MKKIAIFLSTLIIFSYAFANDYQDLKHNKTINELLSKYKNTKDLQKKQFYLTAAAEQHSGLANYLLAQEVNISDPEKIKYYLQAAKYGYPKQSHKAVAQIYQEGLGIKKDDFIAECYKNLSKEQPNSPLILACRSRYPNNGFLLENLGLQSSYEIKRQAGIDYKAFCGDITNNNLFNSTIDKYEQQILIKKICNKDSQRTNKSYIKNGDLIYKDNKIFKKTAKGYMPYNKKIVDGLIVYKPNPPVSLYIAKNHELIPAKDGDQVIKDHHTYIVKNNMLVKYQV